MKTVQVSLFLLIFGCVSLVAQTVSGQISGTVKDTSGALLPGVDIKVTQTDTALTRTVVSNETGSYVIPNLPVGPYRLEATLPGFSTYVQSGIVLQVNSNPAIHIVLQVGNVSETVDIRADAAMVETQTTSVGQVIDNQRVVELPLNGRDVAQLIALSGAAVAGGGGLKSNLNHPDAVAYSVAGGLVNATNYVLDGGNHVDPRTNVGMPLPFPEAMQEFKVETSALPANYGSQPGGAVNVVTKSGTNTVSGNLFWFLRNYVLNARNAFASTRDSLKRNQFGGTLGGPIVKDRFFFFAAAQGTTLRTAPATTRVFVPTAAVLQGDFRTILAPPCKTRQINLVSTLNGQPFATNNVISPSLFNPVAMKYLAMIPVATDPCGELRYATPNETNSYQILGRLDWRRTSSDSAFVRYYITDANLKSYLDPHNVLSHRIGLPDRVQSVIIGDTNVLNPSTITTFRISYSRSAVQRLPPDGIPTVTSLGAKVTSMTPNFTGQGWGPNGYFGGSGLTGYVVTNVYNASENMALTLKSHQLSFGFEWIQTQMNGLGPFQMNPGWTFNGQITGDALADFMTGNVFSVRQGGGQISRDVRNAPGAFIQDNWKLTPRLQFNMGLRWDPYIPSHSRYGYAVRFSKERFDRKEKSTVFVNAPAGLTFPGDPDWGGKSTTTPQYTLLSPRFGLVFDPRGQGRESIRAGYGIFYGSTYLWSTQRVPLNPPWGNTIILNQPRGGISDPWSDYPGGDPFPTPTRFPKDAKFPVAGTFVFENTDNHRPYTQQWDLALQRQFGSDLLASVSYLGNKTTHQTLGKQLNPAPYIPGNCVAGQYGLTAAGPCSTSTNIDARRVLYLQDPANGQYYGSLIMEDPNGNASYNALLLSINKRFAKNFSALANYTWSHCLTQGEPGQDISNFYQDVNNRRAEWGDCSSDRRQLANVSVVARSPAFGSGLVQKMFGNWGFSGIYTYSSGSSLTITPSITSLTGVSNLRANIVGETHVKNPTVDRWFNTEAFQNPAPGQIGNEGATIRLYGPSAWNFDAALWRTFPLREKLKMDFRLEAFNLFNHTRLNNPNTTINNNNFGKITSSQDPRIMQAALKVNF
jgi:hypothetical protein